MGGFASKKQPVITVMLVSQLAGAVMLLGLALLLREPWPQGRDLVLGGVAGVAGMAALATFYKGLSVGRMGVVAPLAAVTTAVNKFSGLTKPCACWVLSWRASGSI